MKDYNQLALLRAEQLGITEYKVIGNNMDYISFFGNDGYYHVRHNLDTGKETRTHQKTTSRPYNYFCG